MTGTALPDSSSLLMHFPPTDTATKVSRATVTRLATQLGFDGDSDVLHYAALRLADQLMPKYEQDDGPLTKKQIAAIRKASPAGKCTSVLSSLF